MEAHEAWCADAGISKQSIGGEWRRVASEIKKRGAEARKGAHGVRQWAGITLAEKSISAGEAVNQASGVAHVAVVPVTSHAHVNPVPTGSAATSATRPTGHGPPPLTDDDLERMLAADGD